MRKAKLESVNREVWSGLKMLKMSFLYKKSYVIWQNITFRFLYIINVEKVSIAIFGVK